MVTDLYMLTLETLAKTLSGTPYPIIILIGENNSLAVFSTSNLENDASQDNLPEQISIDLKQLESQLQGDGKILSVSSDTIPTRELFDFISHLGFETASFLPISNGASFYGLVTVGCYPDHNLFEKDLELSKGIVKLTNMILQQNVSIEKARESIAVGDVLAAINSAIPTPWDTTAFFSSLHELIRQNIGDFAFLAALYDEKTASINVPYLYEEGNVRTLESFPVGEGLTSIILRTKQPLLLTEDVQEKAEALGAKVAGKPAQCWMGAPLIINDMAIGALIVQDIAHENVLDEADLKFLCTLADQVANIIYNALLLDEGRQQISKIQTAAEIARDISSALNLDELLLKAVNLIRDRFNFYHAGIFLVDHSENNVVIREATGEAGAQMKRAGHKLAIGSKSVVGFVAGKGEQLVINDTTKDATHKHNPLLPDTRAEAGIPLKIGDRLLGVLDVQSTVPYSFNPNDLNTFQILADQLAVAVSNTELFAETQEHLSQHRLLHHITTSAASGTTLEESLASAVQGLQVTLGGDRVAILLSDTERKNLVVKAWVGYSEEATNLTVPFGSGITGWVATHRRPLRIDDITQDTRYIQVSANTRSELAIPLIFRNDILGVLNAESEQVAAYTENDEEMLGTLAGSLAAIIANAQLVEQIRKQAERERMLYEITSKIRRSTDIQTILNTTVNELKRATGAHKTQIKIGIETDTEDKQA